MRHKQSYLLNHIKANIGKTVNLHLKNDSVLPCVELLHITNKRLFYKAKRKVDSVFLREVDYAKEVVPYATWEAWTLKRFGDLLLDFESISMELIIERGSHDGKTFEQYIEDLNNLTQFQIEHYLEAP